MDQGVAAPSSIERLHQISVFFPYFSFLNLNQSVFFRMSLPVYLWVSFPKHRLVWDDTSQMSSQLCAVLSRQLGSVLDVNEQLFCWRLLILLPHSFLSVAVVKMMPILNMSKNISIFFFEYCSDDFFLFSVPIISITSIFFLFILRHQFSKSISSLF